VNEKKNTIIVMDQRTRPRREVPTIIATFIVQMCIGRKPFENLLFCRPYENYVNINFSKILLTIRLISIFKILNLDNTIYRS